MKFFVTLFAILIIIASPLSSQNIEDEDEQEREGYSFLLIPILETVSSGNVKWRPDWPSDFPPDAFLVRQGSRLPEVIELSNGEERFTVRRDREGRLLEFPFFQADGYAKVQTSYAANGALRSMNITINNYETEESTEESAEETWHVTFSEGFFPYSDLSLGGAFPAIRVNTGDTDYYVYLFESTFFLTETWYDTNGNMLVFCRASTYVENKAWRIRSLQINDGAETQFVEYHSDSSGNVTEINCEDTVFSAVFRESLPSYWQQNGFKNRLLWDTQGILTLMNISGENDDFYAEYRYGYENDSFGNWIKRQEIAYAVQSDLLAPQPFFSRGVWNRRIVF